MNLRILSLNLDYQIGSIASFEVRIDMWSRKKGGDGRYWVEAEEIYVFSFTGADLDILGEEVHAKLGKILAALSDQDFYLRNANDYFDTPYRHASAFTVDVDGIREDPVFPVGYVYEMINRDLSGVLKLLDGAKHYGRDPMYNKLTGKTK